VLAADHLGVKGHEITADFVSWIGKNIAEKDGTIVAIFRGAGAGESPQGFQADQVLHCKRRTLKSSCISNR
jgi:hypothetical protein